MIVGVAILKVKGKKEMMMITIIGFLFKTIPQIQIAQL